MLKRKYGTVWKMISKARFFLISASQFLVWGCLPDIILFMPNKCSIQVFKKFYFTLIYKQHNSRDLSLCLLSLMQFFRQNAENMRQSA